MHCPWCSNPEGMDFAELDKESIYANEIIDEVLRSRPMFFDGGGVTFTGGEATCQFGELELILKKLKSLGVNTAIETNGTSPLLPRLFPLLDQLIIDFKHPNNLIHKEITGIDNKIIKENLIAAFKAHSNILVRIPLIKGFNENAEALMQFIDFFVSQNTLNTNFELLPYHEYGKEKWKQCGKEYTVIDGYISEETKIMFKKAFEENGLKVITT